MSNLSDNKVEKFIGEIDALDLNILRIDEIKTLVNKLLDGYVVNSYAFNEGRILFRGILFAERPTLFSDLIYPPLELAKQNRASQAGEQMFYCSSSKKSVFYELDVKPGDSLVLSTWVTRNYLIFNNVGFTKQSLEDLGAVTTEHRVIESADPVDKVIADFLAKSFCKKITAENHECYKLSTAIAQIHFSNPEFAGLFYPTVKFNGQEDNFVIKKKVIDADQITLERVEYLEITHVSDTNFYYKIVDFADMIHEGNIEWLNLEESWSLNDQSNDIYFSSESGELSAYDYEGNQVKPDNDK